MHSDWFLIWIGHSIWNCTWKGPHLMKLMFVQPTEVYSRESGVNSELCIEFDVNQLHMFNLNWIELKLFMLGQPSFTICSEFKTKSELYIEHSDWNSIFNNLKLTSSHSSSQWEVMFDRQSCEVANRKRDVNERWVWAGVSCTVCRRGRGEETGRKRSVTPSVGHLFEVLIGGVFIAVLLHLRQVTFIRGHGSIHLRHKWFGLQMNHYFDSFDSYSPCVHRLTSMIPWWMDVYCFFLSITRVMTMMVAMTTPPTIRPIIAPLLELTSSAKKTWTAETKDKHEITVTRAELSSARTTAS